MRPLILVVGLSSVQKKNLYQTRWLADHGFETYILTTHRHPSSISDDQSATIEPTAAGVFGRLRQLSRLLRAESARLHHVELYPGGRFAWVYALLCRVLRLRLLVVERGDIGYARRRAYPLSIRLSLYLCYHLAHTVWYKEPYQGEVLRRWRIRRSFLLPNGVPLPSPPNEERDVDFLWVNRIIAERHPEWFASALARESRSHRVTADFLGFAAEHVRPAMDQLEQRIREMLVAVPTCRCLDFRDPSPHYRQARFFVLPTLVESSNFALLEAMSYGVVPIVTRVDGAHLVVDDNVNGIVVEHDAESLWRGMERALTLDAEQWRALSDKARETIETRYSLDRWGKQLLREYDALVPASGTASPRPRHQ